MTPQVVVCAGGGGVGKTSTSASLAIAASRAGQRVLVVTIDPARRLADALGVSLGPEVQPVDGHDGRLLALMPDPRQAMRTFVRYLFADRPGALQRVLDNRMYQVMEDAIPGVHELAAMCLVTRYLEDEAVDLLVIDTAPSRNAVDFITYPQRLAELLSGRAMRWLAQLAPRADRSVVTDDEDMKPKGRVMKLLERGLGPAIADVGALSAELVGVLDRFIDLNRGSSRLLLGDDTRYVLVAAPTRAARDDARYLDQRLRALSRQPHLVIVNGTAEGEPPHEATLRQADLPAPVAEALRQLADERDERARATEEAVADLRRLDTRLPPLSLPHLGAAPPEAIVEGLAAALHPHLARIAQS